jgi:hypothetical protein
MNGPDYLAHVGHLRGQYRQPDAERLRHDLARQADSIAATIAEATSRLALNYRAAMLAEIERNADETV